MSDGHTSCGTLYSLQHVGHGQLAQAILINRGDRTSHVRLLLYTITNDYHFVECGSVFLNRDVKRLTRGKGHFLCQVADVGNHEGSSFLHVQAEVSVEISHRTSYCILDLHGSADHAVTVLVSYLAFHHASLLDVLNSLFCHCWQWECHDSCCQRHREA